MIEADLAKIGVRVRLVTDQWSAYRAKLQEGEHAMDFRSARSLAVSAASTCPVNGSTATA